MIRAPLDPDPLYAAAMEQAAFDEGYERGIRDSFPPLFTLLLVAFVSAIVAGLLVWAIAVPVVSAAPSSAQTTTPQPGASGAIGSVDVSARVQARTSAEQSPAPHAATAGAFGGTATWYCSSTSPCTAGYGPGDLVAAIDPSTGIRRGARLTVHYGGDQVDVVVVDVCACGGDRVIDLTSGAFLELAPLSAGRIPVSIEYSGARPTPPATDR